MASIETHSAASNGYDGIVYTGSPDGETITGSDKSDSLYGEGGNDTITPYLASVDWRDQVNGGDGVDTLIVDFSSRLGSVTFSEVSVTSPSGTSVWYWISSATVDGESGNASIDYRDFERFNVIGSSTANNSLRGGALDHYLVGGAGSDTIYGYGEVQFDSTSANSGDDTIDIGKGGATAATAGTDTVNMGSGGNDHLIADYSASTEVVSFAWYTYYGSGYDYLSSNTVKIGGVSKLSFSGVERFTVKTGSANDAITTGNGADMVSSGGGNDTINSGKGPDRIDGGAGLDSWATDLSDVAAAVILNLNLVAAPTAVAGGGVVASIEAFGNLKTGVGNDLITTFKSGALVDTVTTGAGNDTVTVFSAATAAATGSDTVHMGPDGNDHLIADYSASTEVVSFAWYTYYGSGYDYLSSNTVTIGGVTKLSFSGVERFTVKTGSANDIITTGNGADVISGGGGSDTINSGKGADRVDGGAGADSWASDQSGVTAAIILNLNVAGATTLAGGAVVSGIERLSNFRTGLGNDVITTLASGGRADTIDTGAGNDKVTVFSAATAAATATDTINMGSGGNDHLIADYSASTEVVSFSWYTYYGPGPDYDSGSLVKIGGLTRLSFTGVERFTVKTGSAADTVNTGDAADVISGGGGNDRLFAHGGNDLVYGGAGADLLSGQGGNDKIFRGPRQRHSLRRRWKRRLLLRCRGKLDEPR